MAILSVVLGTYNRKKYLRATIHSLRIELARLKTASEIIVVDGGSTDGSIRWLSKQKDVILILQHNRGSWNGQSITRKSWGYFMNLGFKAAQGKYICMLSDDCLVVPNAIKNGIELFEQKLNENQNIGAIAFYWRNWPEQSSYVVGLTLGNKMFVNHGLYLTSALKDVGYINEAYSFYHADGDLCLKLWNNGYLTIDSPNSYIEHFSHANIKVRASNTSNQKQDWNLYRNSWKDIYYFTDSDISGGWVEKNFTDNAKTYRTFIKLSNIRLKNKITQFKLWFNDKKNLV